MPGTHKTGLLLRTCRSYASSEKLQLFDERMRVCLREITNANIAGHSWTQSSLPDSFGSLVSVEHMRYPIRLFSPPHAARALCQQNIDFNLQQDLTVTDDLWQACAGVNCSGEGHRLFQKCWDYSLAERAFDDMWTDLIGSDPTAESRLLAIATPGSGT